MVDGQRHKKVLMIVTGHSELGNTGRQTGLYLPEFTHPYEVFYQAGFDIEVASPHGGDAPIDPKSLKDELLSYVHHMKNTLAFKDVKPADYDAFFVVGGHGTMWDLPENRELRDVLEAAYTGNKIVAAVCHGPSALLGLRARDGDYLIRGKRVTGFSNGEEDAAGLTTVMPFLLEDAMKRAGGRYECAPLWEAHVVTDGNLVTGQNPASAKGVGEAVVRLLGAS